MPSVMTSHHPVLPPFDLRHDHLVMLVIGVSMMRVSAAEVEVIGLTAEPAEQHPQTQAANESAADQSLQGEQLFLVAKAGAATKWPTR